jgi:hypothetical protein
MKQMLIKLGNLPLQKTLEFINNFLSQCEREKNPKNVLDCKPLSNPLFVQTTCPPDPSMHFVLILVSGRSGKTDQGLHFLLD